MVAVAAAVRQRGRGGRGRFGAIRRGVLVGASFHCKLNFHLRRRYISLGVDHLAQRRTQHVPYTRTNTHTLAGGGRCTRRGAGTRMSDWGDSGSCHACHAHDGAGASKSVMFCQSSCSVSFSAGALRANLAPQFRRRPCGSCGPPTTLGACRGGCRWWWWPMCDAWFVAVSSQPEGLERTQDMHNGSVARRSHVLAAGITPRAPLLCRPQGSRALAHTRPLLEAVRPRRERPRGDRTGSFALLARKQSLLHFAGRCRHSELSSSFCRRRHSEPRPFPTVQTVRCKSGTQQLSAGVAAQQQQQGNKQAAAAAAKGRDSSRSTTR